MKKELQKKESQEKELVDMVKDKELTVLSHIIYNIYIVGTALKNTDFAANSLSDYNTFVKRDIKELFKNIIVDWGFDIESAYNMFKNNSSKNKFAVTKGKLRIKVAYIPKDLKKPVLIRGRNEANILTPTQALNNKIFYATDLIVDKIVTIINEVTKESITVTIPNQLITKFPIMIGSELCILSNMSNATKIRAGESNVLNGNYIAKGQYNILLKIENKKFNKGEFVSFKEKGKVQYRGSLIGKPAGRYENTFFNMIVLRSTGAITIKVTGNKVRDIIIPYYIMFWIYGVTSDKEIAQIIIGKTDLSDLNDIDKNILDKLNTARTVTYAGWGKFKNGPDILTLIGKKLLSSIKSVIENYGKTLFDIVDKTFMPQMNKTKINPELVKKKKVLVFGQYINKIIRTKYSGSKKTDKHHARNIIFSGSVGALNSILLNKINSFNVEKDVNSFKDMVQNNKFEDIDAERINTYFKGNGKPDQFTKVLEDIIFKGDTDNNTINKSRYLAMRSELKNFTGTVIRNGTTSTKNKVSASAAGTKDNNRQRWVRSIGFVCMFSSAGTGEKVGIVKDTTVLSQFCQEVPIDGITLALEVNKTKGKKDIYVFDNIIRPGTTPVYVNGNIIGHTDMSMAVFCKKYINMRRDRQIPVHMSIIYNIEDNSINFESVAARIFKPVVILYNQVDVDRLIKLKRYNKNDYIRVGRYRIKKIKSEYTYKDMFDFGVLELISPAEEDNCVLAQSLEILTQEESTISEFVTNWTHIEIASNFTALNSAAPEFTNYQIAFRGTFGSIYAKQAIGQASQNLSNLFMPNLFNSNHLEYSNLTTIKSIASPSDTRGLWNIVVPSDGSNAEDGIEASAYSRDHGSLHCTMTKTIKIILDKNFKLGLFDRTTINRPREVNNIHKIGSDGLIKIGSFVKKGDIVASIAEEKSDNSLVDVSIRYDDKSEGRVDDIRRTIENSTEIITLLIILDQKGGTGDKLAFANGNKGVICSFLPYNEIPYDGTLPFADIVVGQFTITTRMVLGQGIGGIVSKGASINGKQYDASIFASIHMDDIRRLNKSVGYRHSGLTSFINPVLGLPYERASAMSLNAVNRLPKIAKEEAHSSGNHGKNNIVDGQALKTSFQKTYKFDEMASHILSAQGAEGLKMEITKHNSAGANVFICLNCHSLGYVNERKNVYGCSGCNIPNIGKFYGSKTTITLLNMLRAGGIKIDLIGEKYIDTIY